MQYRTQELKSDRLEKFNSIGFIFDIRNGAKRLLEIGFEKERRRRTRPSSESNEADVVEQIQDYNGEDELPT